MAEPFISEIRVFSFNFAPRGWALCNGQILPINQNQALFSLLGTTYGGNGQTNFALPDLRGRVPVSMGAGYVLGQRGGEQAHTLTAAEMPAHAHAVLCSNKAANKRSPAGASTTFGVEKTGAALPYRSGSAAYAAMGTQGESSGGSQAHNNMQPYLTLSFCIALQGIFPSQN